MLKGKWHSLTDSKLSKQGCGKSGIASLPDKRRQCSLLGTLKPTWCCHGIEGTSDTWTKPASLALCLSRLSPIISLPAHLHWHSPSQFTATYITLTNQRLQGFFFLLRIYQWHLCLPTRCPFSNAIHLVGKKLPQSNVGSTLSYVSPVNPWSVFCICSPTCNLPHSFFLPLTYTVLFFLSPTSLVPFIVFRSWAYWHVTVEWACLRFCDVRNSVD